MSMREKWVFELPAGKLALAAKAKVEHHTERLQFWKDASAKVMADVREKGIDVETSLAGDNYNNSNRGYAPQITIDGTMQRKLNEADAKIKEHTGKLSEYGGWFQVLSANNSRTYQLNSDDYLYFFGT